jgi:hypothetical protein
VGVSSAAMAEWEDTLGAGGSRRSEPSAPDCACKEMVLTPDFTKCLEATNGDMNSCAYYLEALSESSA